MLPLFKYFVNTALLAPLVVKHVMKLDIDYSQVLNILAVASVLNVLSFCRLGKCHSIKQWFEGVFGLVAGVGFYYIVAVIFGAFLCEAYQRTLIWAVWMSSMTCFPLGLNYGLDFNKWFDVVIRRKDNGNKCEARLICSIYSIWVGAWASSIVIPLDWDRAWQKWPIPNVVGTLLLCLTTSMGFFLKDGCKKCFVGCNWTTCKAESDNQVKPKATPKARTPKKAAAVASPVAKASPAAAIKPAKASPVKAAAPKTPTRKAPAVAGRTRTRSPSKSPVKRGASPTKAAAATAPSTPKTSVRSRSKAATPSATGRASSRMSKRTRD